MFDTFFSTLSKKSESYETPEYLPSSDINILFYDEDNSIIESIKNIVEIPKNTRIMNNEFGSMLQSYLVIPFLPRSDTGMQLPNLKGIFRMNQLRFWMFWELVEQLDWSNQRMPILMTLNRQG